MHAEPTPADIFGPDMAKCCCTTAPQQKQERIVIDGLFVMGYGGQKTGIIQQVTGRELIII
jgi:hypothetical protein